jgi:SAM-dependent methyltransferase
MTDFYDELAPLYHLIFQDWDASIARQGEQLQRIIHTQWPQHQSVLDVTCGIGTQAIALAIRGFRVKGSDLSVKAIERATLEAKKRGQEIPFSVCDMRDAHAHHGTGFDVVLSCDNSVPHLLTDRDILAAFKEMLACLRAGGGCVISVRDYDHEQRGRNIVKPYGVREEDGKRYFGFQVWDFDGEHYDFTMFLIEEDSISKAVRTHTMRSRYYAIGTQRLLTLMREAGFQNVRQLDEVFYQPVLVGTKGAE